MLQHLGFLKIHLVRCSIIERRMKPLLIIKLNLTPFFGQRKIALIVENCGDLVTFETPEFIGNIPDVVCECQEIGR